MGDPNTGRGSESHRGRGRGSADHDDSGNGRGNGNGRGRGSMSRHGRGNDSSSAIGNGNGRGSGQASASATATASGHGNESTSSSSNTIPSSLQQFQTLENAATALTQSWIMVPFLQAIFECDIQEHNTSFFVISKFYPTTNSWREDILHYRESLKKLPNRIYDKLRRKLGLDAGLAYIPAFTQDTLLFNFDNSRYNTSQLESDEAREFYNITGQSSQNPNLFYQDDINRMNEISKRLLEAIGNLKIRYATYQENAGEYDIPAEDLATQYTEGLQPPYF